MVPVSLNYTSSCLKKVVNFYCTYVCADIKFLYFYFKEIVIAQHWVDKIVHDTSIIGNIRSYCYFFSTLSVASSAIK